MRDREREQQQDFRPGSQGHGPGAEQRGPWSGAGQIVMGPSFYVWDESPRQAREWGVELANAWLSRRR
jgi:hypothetical protein